MPIETIAALSSGQLPSGVALVRVSGTKAQAVIRAIAGGLPEPRRASLRTFHAVDGTPIDRGIVLYFDGPATATGEDVAEFHCHGGRAVIDALLGAITAIDGVRLAEAGEFTRRAFENGRMDLTEAEGLGDLLAAETEGQRRAAFDQAGGTLRTLYVGWADRLTKARAMMEASFDFSDEGDVGDAADSGVRASIASLRTEIAGHLDRAQRGEILRNGYRIAIVGAPNAGKSSLLNALADREAAIVTDVPGTTRDVISVTLDLAGVPVVLSDTAGIRETQDKVEAIGVAKARAIMNEADLVLALEDPRSARSPFSRLKSLFSYVKPSLGPVGGTLDEEDEAEAPRREHEILTVRTKVDLASGETPHEAIPHLETGGYDFTISAKTGAGIAELVETLAQKAREAAGDPSSAIPLRLRQREILLEVDAIFEDYLDSSDMPAEVAAETLRSAAIRLGALTGAVGVEDLLDVIFSEFCIGK